jgi:hypothetical protein
MKSFFSRQRLFALLLILGAAFLLFRTIMMMNQGYLEIFVLWVALLLILEFLVDAACLLSCIRWLVSQDRLASQLALRMTAAVIIVHAIRVILFVMGRVSPWINFDVRPEYRVLHHTRWSWEGVYFAGIMSALSLIILLLLWIYKRKRKTHEN